MTRARGRAGHTHLGGAHAGWTVGGGNGTRTGRGLSRCPAPRGGRTRPRGRTLCSARREGSGISPLTPRSSSGGAAGLSHRPVPNSHFGQRRAARPRPRPARPPRTEAGPGGRDAPPPARNAPPPGAERPGLRETPAAGVRVGSARAPPPPPHPRQDPPRPAAAVPRAPRGAARVGGACGGADSTPLPLRPLQGGGWGRPRGRPKPRSGAGRSARGRRPRSRARGPERQAARGGGSGLEAGVRTPRPLPPPPARSPVQASDPH